MAIQKGIYDNQENGLSVKITYTKKKGTYANMFYTNNRKFGKSHFGLEGIHLINFMKGYKKRKVK